MLLKKSLLPKVLAALALVAGAQAARADEHAGHAHEHGAKAHDHGSQGHDHGSQGHDHGAKAHDHGAHDHAEAEKKDGASAPMSSHDGMTALYGHIADLEKAFAAGNTGAIHDHAEAMGTAMKDLDKDTSLTPQKKTRVQGYVKNVGKLAHKMHDYADAQQLEPAKKEFAKLKAQVDLLDRQFPHSHKPGAAKAPDSGAGGHKGH